MASENIVGAKMVRGGTCCGVHTACIAWLFGDIHGKGVVLLFGFVPSS